MNQWVKPARSTATPDYDVAIRPGDPGWHHTGLLVTDLAEGESRTVSTGSPAARASRSSACPPAMASRQFSWPQRQATVRPPGWPT